MKLFNLFTSVSKSDVLFFIIAVVVFVLAMAFVFAFQYGNSDLTGILGLVLFIGIPAVIVIAVFILD
jgi:hypothetical protein